MCAAKNMESIFFQRESCKILIRHSYRHSEEIDHTHTSTLSHRIKIYLRKFYSSSQSAKRLRKQLFVVYLYSCLLLQQSCDWIDIYTLIEFSGTQFASIRMLKKGKNASDTLIKLFYK